MKYKMSQLNKSSTRKFIAITLTCIYCILALAGHIATDSFTTVYSLVLGFYFGRSTALDVPATPRERANNEQ